jgi:predicted metal-dependent phosphoesterase TrpH
MILSIARCYRIDVLIVTDHDSLRGSQLVARLAHGNPKFVVIAGEYKSDKGDIIGLFLKDEVKSENSDEILREIRRQGGLTVLPHPYKGHKLDDPFLHQIDLIETYNGRCSEAQNQAAEQLSRQWGKPALAGCDAHFPVELKCAVTEFAAPSPKTEVELRDLLLHSPRSMRVRPVTRVYQPLSQMIKAVKTRDLYLFISQSKRAGTVLGKDIVARLSRRGTF